MACFLLGATLDVDPLLVQSFSSCFVLNIVVGPPTTVISIKIHRIHVYVGKIQADEREHIMNRQTQTTHRAKAPCSTPPLLRTS